MRQRLEYRHVFPLEKRLAVEATLADGSSLHGWIVDLSLGGMLVKLTDPGLRLDPEKWVLVSFETPAGPFEYHCRVIHASTRPCQFYGLKFLELTDRAANGRREQMLGNYLRMEQTAAKRRERIPLKPARS
jgi:c-di-GMP-binding flagellar brake protein YcgR